MEIILALTSVVLVLVLACILRSRAMRDVPRRTGASNRESNTQQKKGRGHF